MYKIFKLKTVAKIKINILHYYYSSYCYFSKIMCYSQMHVRSWLLILTRHQ